MFLASLADWQASLLAAGQTDAAPCVACQGVSLTQAQLPLLPSSLNGMLVLVLEPAAEAWPRITADIRSRGGRPGLHLARPPEPADPRLATGGELVAIDAAGTDLDRLAFDLKGAFSSARGRSAFGRLLVVAEAPTEAALRERGLAPYVDGFILPAAPIRSIADLLQPDVRSLRLRSVGRLTDAEARGVLLAAADLQSWFPDGLVAVRDRALSCGERRVPAFLNPRTLDLVGAATECAAEAPAASDMAGAIVERYAAGDMTAFLARAGGGDRFAEGVDVSGARALTADEIVARHQGAAAAQQAAIRTDIATGTFALTFEAPGFIAPITVTSEITMYRGSRSEGREAEELTEVRQGNIRVNGVPFNANGGVPKLPIIEPERASAPPLAITLSNAYRYRLAGRETLGGRDAYVIAFEPRVSGESLFKGRAWIDVETFGIARVSAAQTDLKGPVTASEQTDDFALDAGGWWLLARSDIRQTYEGASVRTPIHRLLIIERHALNAADFDAQLAAAHGSNDVMLRDTPDGFRYLARPGKPEAGSGQPAAAATRILAGRNQRIRTLAFGVIVDPNISIPLPFAGLSYVDFNLFGTGTQFSGFFGGSYGQLAFSAPSLRGTRWQLSGRAFAIASSYNDRAFDDGREQYELDFRQRPAQASVWLLRPVSARTTLRIEYDWDYNRYSRADETASDFVIPRNQNAHALRVAIEGQRAGWQGSVWGSYARRIGWREWGVPGRTDYRAEHAAFQRFGATLLRAQAWTPRLTTRIEAAFMAGRHLDRFSRYAFGTFDNRLHGYPAALIRYDRGAVARSAAAWSMGAVRIDAFADIAAVRDPGFGHGFRPYPGVGAALEAPGPFRTLLSLEWGYGLQGITTEGKRGTHVLRLSGYKVF